MSHVPSDSIYAVQTPKINPVSALRWEGVNTLADLPRFRCRFDSDRPLQKSTTYSAFSSAGQSFLTNPCHCPPKNT
jgi:hypothetical protein